MSTENTPNNIRGFVIPHDIDQTNINMTDSTFTQSGNRAGDPVPQQASALVLRATGEQTAGSDLQIRTNKSGHAGAKGEFVWIDNTVSSEPFGRDIPAHITGYDVADFGSSTSSYKYPNSIALDDGTLYVVVYAKEAAWLTRSEEHTSELQEFMLIIGQRILTHTQQSIYMHIQQHHLRQ